MAVVPVTPKFQTPTAFPADVMAVVPEAAWNDITAVPLVSTKVRLVPNLNVVPVTVNVTAALWVRVSALEALASKFKMDRLALITLGPAPLFASKMIESPATGAAACAAPPEVVDQLVGAVAVQFVLEPPPIQNAFAI